MPLTHNDGRPVSQETFLQTWDELATRFGGLSYLAQTVHGVWFQESHRYEDESIRIFVDVDDTPEHRTFFAAYKLTLQERFEQIVIYVRSYPVDII